MTETALPLPLSCWAQERIDRLQQNAAGATLPSADALMRERALINHHRVADKVSAGGGCRFYKTQDGWIALNLSRPCDADLLPALLQGDFEDLVDAIGKHREHVLVERGRLLGLAIAGLHESAPPRPAMSHHAGLPRTLLRTPRVLDLSALWAGPLASRLLRLSGCEVTRVDSFSRPDPLEQSDPAHFEALNKGKTRVKLELRSEVGRSRLLALVAESDIVIEAARPRALLQLGIDAEALVRSQPGLTWVSITGHGAKAEAAEWIAFGDDAGVSGGLSREMQSASGAVGFVGDAIADPLTGIVAADAALRQHLSGFAARITLSMRDLVAEAIAAEKSLAPGRWQELLRGWSAMRGLQFSKREPAGALEPC